MSIASTSSESNLSLMESLLAEQQSLSAVERFSILHDAQAITARPEPDQAKYYKSLLPASPPGPGQQYRFAVDLDTCSGCKACVVACHTLNGLADDESWRQVGTMITTDLLPRLQHVTTACHHCADPGCLSGCPVNAYVKVVDTGIVRHLDDQCIGCKYCTMTCPYEVPQYNRQLGIVRKCDLCSQRLAHGEAPACVQACPNSAISIELIDIDSLDNGGRLVAGAPPSSITIPSTIYKTRHHAELVLAMAQNHAIDEQAECHWPLAILLVATQASVGMLVVERLLASFSTIPTSTSAAVAVSALVFVILGLGIGVLHLGKPLRAWRIFLGLSTSWLSREAVVLGMYTGLLAVTTSLLVANVRPELSTRLLPDIVRSFADSLTQSPWISLLLWTALVTGLVGLFTSGMVYAATSRAMWRAERTLPNFLSSALITGMGCSLPVVAIFSIASTAIILLADLFLLSMTAKLCWEYHYRYCAPSHSSRGCLREIDYLDYRSQKISTGQLLCCSIARFGLAFVALMMTPLFVLAATNQWTTSAVSVAVVIALSALASETCERLLYFGSIVTPRMPGTLQ